MRGTRPDQLLPNYSSRTKRRKWKQSIVSVVTRVNQEKKAETCKMRPGVTPTVKNQSAKRNRGAFEERRDPGKGKHRHVL